MNKILLWIGGILAVAGLAATQVPASTTQSAVPIEVPAIVKTTTLPSNIFPTTAPTTATTTKSTTTTVQTKPSTTTTTTTPYAPNGTYKNVDGNTVPSPYQAPNVPSGASAQCRDGSYSFSQHRSGTCSRHGGVAEWL